MSCKVVKILEKELDKAQDNMRWAMDRYKTFPVTRDKFQEVALRAIEALKNHSCSCCCGKGKCKCKK